LFSEAMSDSDGDNIGAEAVAVARLVKRIQYADWRALRKTEETDRAYPEAVERLAQTGNSSPHARNDGKRPKRHAS
jgi:hypothetical protein